FQLDETVVEKVNQNGHQVSFQNNHVPVKSRITGFFLRHQMEKSCMQPNGFSGIFPQILPQFFLFAAFIDKRAEIGLGKIETENHGKRRMSEHSPERTDRENGEKTRGIRKGFERP